MLSAESEWTNHMGEAAQDPMTYNVQHRVFIRVLCRYKSLLNLLCSVIFTYSPLSFVLFYFSNMAMFDESIGVESKFTYPQTEALLSSVNVTS